VAPFIYLIFFVYLRGKVIKTKMIISQVLPLLSAIFVIGLGFFILLKNLKSSINIVFFFLSVVVTIWLVGTYRMFVSVVDDQIMFWDRFIYIGVVYVPSLMYHFSILFTKQKKQGQSVFLSYVVGTFFLIMSSTPYFVEGVFRYEWGVHSKAQLFHHIFMLYFAVFIGLLFYNVVKFYRFTDSGVARSQARYVLLAFGVLVSIGTLGFLPAYGISIFPFSYLSGLFFTIILAYSILKYRFMDIRFIFKKSTVFLASLLLALGSSYFIFNFLTWNFPRVDNLDILALLVGLLVMQPARLLFGYIANKYFFADIYDYNEVLRDLSHRLTSTIDLDEIATAIVNTVLDSFRLEKTGLVLHKQINSSVRFQSVKVHGFSKQELNTFSNNQFLKKYLEINQGALSVDEIPLRVRRIHDQEFVNNLLALMKLMRELHITLCIPMFKENHLLGLLILGRKISKESYSNKDFELVETLANQASVALDNALLYQKVKDFNLELQNKVDAATKDLMRTNKKLQYTNANLQQLDKAKSEFLSITSHQLRTPLSGIKGYLSMLIDGDFGKMTPRVGKVIKELYQNSERMSRLINTFLNISRIEANRLMLNKTEVDFTELLRTTFNDFKPEAKKKNLKYLLHLPKKNICFYMDSDKIKDVVINLIDNAIKYTLQGEVVISAEMDAKKLTIKVEDTGVGMKPSEIDNLFQKFSRGIGIAQINTGGSGLGLYIVRKITEAHCGKAFAKSRGKDKGSVFGVELPICKKVR